MRRGRHRQCDRSEREKRGKQPERCGVEFHRLLSAALVQIPAAIIKTTIAAQIAGVIFFELPLRGESLAAWLNSVFMT